MDSSQPKDPEADGPHVNVMGTSRHPEYNVGGNDSRFGRGQDSRRLAPVSQLNTSAGRTLAQQQAQGPLNYTEGDSRSVNRIPPPKRSGGSKRRLVLPQAFHDHGGVSDRDLLPSQRSRTGLAQLVGVARFHSQKGLSQVPLEAEQAPPCPECGQTGTDHNPSFGFSHICPTCQRFVPAKITALQPSPTPQDPEPTPPPQPSNPPQPIKCNTCLAIPPSFLQEFLQFFPTCRVCGSMTDKTLTDLVAFEGEVPGLVDDNGRCIFAASKELQDWCFRVASMAHRLNRKASKNSLAESLEENEAMRLKRKGAVGSYKLRSSKKSTSRSGSESHPGLVPFDEGGKDIDYMVPLSFRPNAQRMSLKRTTRFPVRPQPIAEETSSRTQALSSRTSDTVSPQMTRFPVRPQSKVEDTSFQTPNGQTLNTVVSRSSDSRHATEVSQGRTDMPVTSDEVSKPRIARTFTEILRNKE